MNGTTAASRSTARTRGSESVLRLRGVSKTYAMGEVEVHALRDVDFDRYAGEFLVLLVEGERAVLRSVRIGRRNGLAAEALSGLAAGAEAALYPSELIEVGARLEVRR